MLTQITRIEDLCVRIQLYTAAGQLTGRGHRTFQQKKYYVPPKTAPMIRPNQTVGR